MRESPRSGPRSPEERRRQRQRRGQQRGLTLLFVIIVVVLVVVLAVTVPRHGNSGTSSTTSSTTSTTSSDGSDGGTGTSEGSGTDTSDGTGSTDSSDTGGSTGTSGGDNTATTTYTAELTGGNVVPGVDTAASGTLTFTISADGTTVDYQFKVSSIISLTLAKLHQGKTGENGATIMTIYKGPTKDGLYSGTVAHGSFKAKDLGGPLKGKTIDDLVGMIEANDVYLLVGTAGHPGGELRGQLQ
jgi:hypothetical protein